MPTTLPLDQLIADPSVHPRTRIRQGTIRQYAASYKEGDTLPPVDVFKSPDGRHLEAEHGATSVILARREVARRCLPRTSTVDSTSTR